MLWCDAFDQVHISVRKAKQYQIIVARKRMVDIGAAGELAKGTPRTIMTMFAAPDTAPPEMTRIDRAYLAALYRLRTNATAIEVLLAAARSIAGESTRRR